MAKISTCSFYVFQCKLTQRNALDIFLVFDVIIGFPGNKKCCQAQQMILVLMQYSTPIAIDIIFFKDHITGMHTYAKR
jgi:hypothetical protein